VRNGQGERTALSIDFSGNAQTVKPFLPLAVQLSMALPGRFASSPSEQACTLVVDWKMGLGGAALKSLDVSVLEDGFEPRTIPFAEDQPFKGQMAKNIVRKANVPMRVTINGIMEDGTHIPAYAYLSSYEPPATIITDEILSGDPAHLQSHEFPGFARGARLRARFTYVAEGRGLVRYYASSMGTQVEDKEHLGDEQKIKDLVLTLNHIPPNSPFTLAGHITSDDPVYPRMLKVKYHVIGFN
jgi:hypothetical protein